MNIKTKFYKRVLGTPVVLLMPEAWKYLMDAGYTNEWVLPYHEDDSAVLAYQERPDQKDFLIGFISFRVFANEAWICISYVKEDQRNKGVYTQMFAEVVKECKELNLLRITGGTAAENITMQNVYAKTGRIKQHEVWSYPIK